MYQVHVSTSGRSSALVASTFHKLTWGTQLHGPCVMHILPNEQLARQACTTNGQGTPLKRCWQFKGMQLELVDCVYGCKLGQ